MEDVLDLYEEDYDERFPVVCFDEKPYQMLHDILEPLPTVKGKAKRQDYEYKRDGVCNIFVAVEPKAGTRFVQVSEQRKKDDFALFIKKLLEHCYPQAVKIRIVMDNLNTHTLGSLYHALSPEEARRIARKIEPHYTPKHASWLNMAEIEISALTQQCLKRRLARIFHRFLSQGGQDGAPNLFSIEREHCQRDKASEIEDKFGVADCPDCNKNR